MGYEAQQLIESLRETRLAKGMSQSELSKLTGIPQAQISRIEANAVDLRLSSFIAIVHALDREAMLVPRKAIPAIRSIIRQTAEPQQHNQSVHARSKSAMRDAPRPAYRLDEDDND